MYIDYMNRYLELANSRAYLNHKLNKGMFLSLCGSMVHKRGMQIQVLNRIDPRINTLLVQPSRSGKGAALAVAKAFAKYLKLNVTQELSFTDAGLVGKVDSKMHQKNREKGYTVDDPDFMDPVILGDLGLFDVITFPEAKVMFQAKGYKEDLLEILQQAMDTPGDVDKKLSDDVRIKYQSDSSIIATTYFLDEFEEVLLKQGMFQRLLIFIEHFGEEKRDALNDAMCGFFPEDFKPVLHDDFEPMMSELADNITESVNSFERGHVFEKDESASSTLRYFKDHRANFINTSFRGRDKIIILPYSTAILNMHHKLAGVAAALNGSDYITRREIEETKPEIDNYFKCVVNDIITRVGGTHSEEKIRHTVINMLKKSPKGLNMRTIKQSLEEMYIMDPRRVGLVVKSMTKNKELVRLEPSRLYVLNR